MAHKNKILNTLVCCRLGVTSGGFLIVCIAAILIFLSVFCFAERITAPIKVNPYDIGAELTSAPDQIPPDPTFNKIKTVTQTIVISEPGVYDYGNVLYIWKGDGNCNQTENQPHIMRIAASNVTIRNFAYKNAPDGIHIACCGKGQGNDCTDCSIENILLENVTGWACEDALTTGNGTSNITINRCFFLGNPNKDYRDKLLQVNFGNNLRIYNTVFKNSPRPIRFKSGAVITIKYNRFYDFRQAVRGDTYKDITGIIPNQPATVMSEGNYFQNGRTAFSMMGKITVTSIADSFSNVERQREEKDGAKVNMK